jgi:hypothetical protein
MLQKVTVSHVNLVNGATRQRFQEVRRPPNYYKMFKCWKSIGSYWLESHVQDEKGGFLLTQTNYFCLTSHF